MITIKVAEEKFKINGEEYLFRFDFESLVKYEEIFGKEGRKDLIKLLTEYDGIYETGAKLISVSCKDRDFTLEEVKQGLQFDISTMYRFEEVLQSLVTGVVKEKKESEGNEDKKK